MTMTGVFSAKHGLRNFVESRFEDAIIEESVDRQGAAISKVQSAPRQGSVRGYLLAETRDGRHVVTLTCRTASDKIHTYLWDDQISFGEMGDVHVPAELRLPPVMHPLAFDADSPVGRALINKAFGGKLSNDDLAAAIELAAELSVDSPLKGRKITAEVADALVVKAKAHSGSNFPHDAVPDSLEDLVSLVDRIGHDGGGALRY